ncbi:SusE domain-containing protein [Aquimarina litoralis]|uniref:SusE domain-containing protein n=1 Tax=Aquimarina litoralis TaxID=584605 RepID=UPI001C571879|nr:SusE domain-containing protein [Aquimarina litoralis]MBW1296882.1 hypothetical protein [Aquimarina litoralis]
MKNIVINRIIVMLVILMSITSCENNDDLIVANSDATTGAPVFSVNNLQLDNANEDEEVLTITFQEPDFGFNAGSISYQLLFDLEEGNFSSPEIVSVTNGFAITFTTAQLNQVLINLGAEPEEETEVFVKVETVLSNDTSWFSDVESIMVTPYMSALDLSSRWGLVGSATINGWDGPDMPFYQSTDSNEPAGTFVAYVDLIDGAIKIRADNDWTINYGDNEPDTTLESGGNDILVSAGTYKILFNENSLEYSIEPYSWGLVGDATVNGWDGPDMPLTYNPLFDNWTAEVTLQNGNLKIRFNNDWEINYGDTENDGILEPGTLNNNIPITAGNYTVTFNPTTLEYGLKQN